MCRCASSRCDTQPGHASRILRARSAPPTSPVPVTAWSAASVGRSRRSNLPASDIPSSARLSAYCRWSSLLLRQTYSFWLPMTIYTKLFTPSASALDPTFMTLDPTFTTLDPTFMTLDSTFTTLDPTFMTLDLTFMTLDPTFMTLDPTF